MIVILGLVAVPFAVRFVVVAIALVRDFAHGAQNASSSMLKKSYHIGI